jgi:uncharacterized membrane protein YiaA
VLQSGNVLSQMDSGINQQFSSRPSGAFVGASWGAMIVGMAAYLIGLSNAQVQLNEKVYYLTILLYGSFAAVSLPCTTVGTATCNRHVGLWRISLVAPILFLAVGLFNATLLPGEKGFFAMSFVLVLFAIVSVQKNVRDLSAAGTAQVRTVD